MTSSLNLAKPSISTASATALLTAAKEAATERCHGYIKPIDALFKSNRNISDLFENVELHLNTLAFALDVSLGVDKADLGLADEAVKRRQVIEHAHGVIIESGVIDRYIGFLVQLVKTGMTAVSGTATGTAGYMLNRLQNSVDKSLNFCHYLASRQKFFQDFFEPLLTSGVELKIGPQSEATVSTVRDLIRQAMSICVNALFKDDQQIYSLMVSQYRLKQCAEPYLKCEEDRKLSTIALILIAFVVDERQADIFLGARDNLAYLVGVLDGGLTAEDRRFEGFEVSESAKCLNRLALNDVNKDLLIDLDLLPVLQRMLSSSNPKDTVHGLDILFTLSFSKKNSGKIATNFYKKLKQLQETERWRDNKVLQSLLFRLKQESSDILGIKQSLAKPYNVNLKQIMISYNHSSKQLVQRLYNRLNECGFNVWVDFKDLTKGSTLDGMSTAVETSSIVLVCVTRLYKESNNCRLEAEYAWKCDRRLIYLLMEPKYKATGWLGILMGTQLYYDLTESKYPFEQKFSELLKMLLNGMDSADNGEEIKAPIRPPAATNKVDSKQREQKNEDLRNWDASRVRIWCRECRLPDKISTLTGQELYFLADSRRRSPEYFGRLMDQHFGFDRLLDLARFANALDDL